MLCPEMLRRSARRENLGGCSRRPRHPKRAKVQLVKRYFMLGLSLVLSLSACGFRGGPDADPALLPCYRTELRDTATTTLPVLAHALDGTLKNGKFKWLIRFEGVVVA